MPATVAPVDFIDPRGRVDRKGLAVIALALLAGQIAVYGAGWISGLDFEGPLAMVIHSFFFWAATAAVSKRLHDLGRSAWTMLAAIAVWFVWAFVLAFSILAYFGPAAVDPSDMASPATLAVATGAVIPVVVAILWLHFAKGDQGTNRFGPVPDASGFARYGEIGPAAWMGSGALQR